MKKFTLILLSLCFTMTTWAQIDLTKEYRITTGAGKYLNVPNDNTEPEANATNGTVTAAAENVTSGEQIFKFEEGENGNYYLKNANGYYLVCASSAVYASQTKKTNLTIEAVGDSYYLRDADYASHQSGGTTDTTNSDPSNYLKETNGYVYSNGNSMRKDSYTWIIEEYVATETPDGGEGEGEGEGDETPDAILQSVVFDFSNNAWSIPTQAETNYNGVKTKENYTNDNVEIIIDPTANNGAFYYENGYVRLGRTGTKLILPAFAFPVEKIEVIGHSAAKDYATSEMNVYVGSTAVSTTTKGSTATNTYEIAADYQAAGNVFELVVGMNNGQIGAYIFISAIKVYPKGEKLEAPVLSVAAGEYTEKPITVKVSSNAEALGATDIVYYYTTNGYIPTEDDEEFPAEGLEISENTTLKVVVACKYNGKEYISDVTTAEYTFRDLSATLNLVKVTPDAPVTVLDNITLEFEDEVVLGAMVQLKLKKGTDRVAILDNRHASVNGKVVTVSLGTYMQTEVGEYTLEVVSGSIKRASDGVEYTGTLNFTVTNPFKLVKVTPAETETVEKLESITIEFSDDIVSKFDATAAVKLWADKDAMNPIVIYNIVAEGKVLTLTLTEPITTPDTYRLNFPAKKIVRASDGVEFEGAELKFTVVEPFTATVTPAEPVEVLDVITIEFSHDIESKFDATAAVKLWADKDAMNPIVIYNIVAEGKVLTLTLTEPITTPDTYRLNFPANKIVRASDKKEFAGGTFVFEVKEVEDATAIDAVAADADAVIYDLSGRRVKEITVKGIYIVNGKKVIK